MNVKYLAHSSQLNVCIYSSLNIAAFKEFGFPLGILCH